MDDEKLIMEELDEDTTIGWWNENRKKINKLIKKFNKWQIKHELSNKKGQVLLAKIKLLNEFGEENEFSDWQFDILKEMSEFIKNKGIMEDKNISLIMELSEETNIDWWNENRKIINSVIRAYNKWQTKYNFDANKKMELIKEIDTIIEDNNNSDMNDFSDWQIEILEKIKQDMNS